MTTAVPLSVRLDREWAHLGRRRAILDQVRSWQLTASPFHSLDDFLRLTGFVARVSRAPAARSTGWLGPAQDVDGSIAAPVVAPVPVHGDDVLVGLVQIAPDEWLAGRIVLQRILPGLLGLARTEQERDPTVDAFGLLVGEAWLSILAYRAEGRHTDVAARLLNAARHRAFTNPRRRACVTTEVLTAPHRIAEPSLPPERSAFEQLADVVSTARACGLTSSDAAMVGELLAHETTSQHAASASVSSRTVRYRRQRVATAIRELVA